MPRHNHFSTFNLHEKKKKKQENDQQIIISLSAVVNTKSLSLSVYSLSFSLGSWTERSQDKKKITEKKTKNKTEINHPTSWEETMSTEGGETKKKKKKEEEHFPFFGVFVVVVCALEFES